jgi:hypothetical protein
MRAAVLGVGAVGSRAARQLLSTDVVDEVLVVDAEESRARVVAESLGDGARGATVDEALRSAAVVVLALPMHHRQLAEYAMRGGVDVVSTCDDVDEVRSLLALDSEARERGRSIVVGAAFSPGMTCVLARHAAASFDWVDEIHVAKAGTGGPACARQHHRALGGGAFDWRQGAWVRRAGASGRELCWFPDPVGGQDCYRAALPDPLLLLQAFPHLRRLTARMAATRRDRLTFRLPMLRRPHPEGVIGGVRVEVRGQRGPIRHVEVLGAVDRPGLAAGAMAAVAAVTVAEGRVVRRGAAGLAELLDDPVPFLRELARRGVKAAAFEGSSGEVEVEAGEGAAS